VTTQARLWIGLVASVLTVLGSEAAASLYPSLHHLFTLLGLIGTAISGYLIQSPGAPNDPARKE
jgi:hypothetical protein